MGLSKRLDWRRLSLKAGLSAFAVFHLFAVITIPNRTSYLGGQFGSVIAPYANILELTADWALFAPDPGVPIYLEWELENRDGARIMAGQWPEVPSPYFFNDRHVRRLTALRYMVSESGKAEAMFVPYLCQSRPDVFAVRLWRAVSPVPASDEVLTGIREIGDLGHLERTVVAHAFCEKRVEGTTPRRLASESSDDGT